MVKETYTSRPAHDLKLEGIREKETYTSRLDCILDKNELSKEGIVFLLKLDRREHLGRLFKKADEVREEYIGEDVYVRGVLEFSNYCRNDCLYCGIRKSNLKLRRYRIKPEEIVGIAKNAVSSLGFRTVLLQSGEDGYYTTEVVEDMIKRILEKCDCRVALSIGERTVEEYKRFYDAGARRCLVRFETSNKKLFEKLHPKSSQTKNSFGRRVKLIKRLGKIGYQVGTGFMVGLPGQSIEDLAGDILMYDRLKANMAGTGPFICHPDTPLACSNNGSFEMSLKVIAVTRIACKDIFISATTALQSLNNANGRELALQAGANLLMPNITPKKYRMLYQLYPNKACVYENPFDCANCVKKVVETVGRTIGRGYGDAIRK
ncbi:MAG: [FeFe] hydrogenase H-cluster radical SAM maturase HydE [Candidatus Altiarchaeales archaeon]|nr:[FeFe] hydrogenase H-cluster radical SAM maturase HydE [Candidatus Altiarchaeales archaeon]